MRTQAIRPLTFFDAHNHVHLGPNPASAAMTKNLHGLALMSTHPRDFRIVSQTISELRHQYHQKEEDDNNNNTFVPCFGVHPWFLHEIDKTNPSSSSSSVSWLDDLHKSLELHPDAAVGEIGLDGVRYSPDTGELVSSMEDQKTAFEAQMRIAHDHDRAAIIHAVQCWGPLFEVLSQLKKEGALPPKLYFHAFGGKPGVVDQLLALSKKKNKNGTNTDVYFGFAPCVNLRSPKTRSVIQKVGMERIVLETDLEDASLVSDHIVLGAGFISEALQIPVEDVALESWDNSRRLYGIS